MCLGVNFVKSHIIHNAEFIPNNRLFVTSVYMETYTTEIIRTCNLSTCGKKFTVKSGSSRKKYCSKKCKQIVKNIRRRKKEPKECANPDCNEMFTPSEGKKLYCRRSCWKRYNYKFRYGTKGNRTEVQQRAVDYNKRKANRTRRALLGRICKWCGVDDSQALWSLNKEACARCERQRQRSQCPKGGGPLWKTKGCLCCEDFPYDLV